MKEVFAPFDLELIQAGHEVEMKASFLEFGSNGFRRHLLVVHPVIPDREGRTWWSADDPVRVELLHHSSRLTAIGRFAEIPLFTIWFWGS